MEKYAKLASLVMVKKIKNRRRRISNSSSSDSDEDLILRKHKKRVAHMKIKNYMKTIISYNNDDFQSHFRLTRTLVEEFMNEMEGFSVVKSTGRPPVKPIEAVLLTLWTLANQESFREIGDRFQFSPGHAHTIFTKTIIFITDQRHRFIKWPEGNALNRSIADFRNLRNVSFPNVVGCVDGCHIQILGDRNDNSYYNRKGTYSIILQAICNSSMEFIDIFTGWPGSTHDARVWRNSPIYRKLENNLLPYDLHVLGDTAYPLDTFIMVPFKDNGHLSRQQKKYNKILSSTRVVIEQAFGRLKGLWRRLKFLNLLERKYCKYIIAAACVLHNLCIRGNIPYNIQDEDLENFVIFDNIHQNEPVRNAGTVKRNQIMAEL